VSVNSIGFLADDAEQARAEFWPYYEVGMGQIAKERGFTPPTPGGFRSQTSPSGALVVGDVEEVAAKLLLHHQLFGNERFLFQIGVGTMPHAKVMRAIELFGTEVAPIVRAEVARREAEGGAGTGAAEKDAGDGPLLAE
jgi:alkanesulfonate monooxygenase SsuD/methylene tetrahydromethanopterin reductase-like flavin-dependent oxidoreductase (luciferase family)